jgi:perosamine synthetase
MSDVAAFSFYANKVLTCGEGGMVTTNNEAYATRAKYYRNLCFDTDPEKRFIHENVGFNYRLTNVQAAIGFSQTESADELVDMRRAMAKKYLERLGGLREYIQLPAEKPWAKNCYWMFGIVLRDSVKINAEKLLRVLASKGVDTRRFFYPGHLQPVFKEFSKGVHAPVSEMLWERGIYLPSSSDLTDDEADKVTEALKSSLTGSH